MPIIQAKPVRLATRYAKTGRPETMEAVTDPVQRRAFVSRSRPRLVETVYEEDPIAIRVKVKC